MSWPQTLAICGSIFLAIGLNDPKACQVVGLILLFGVIAWPVLANMREEIKRRNQEEMEKIKRERGEL